ncbi:MAG: putative manganese-dependent inorganic diphosphatase [Chthoniobacterales bacterium]
MQTIVIGHKNPDMDAICSALGYAEFKRRLGRHDIIAGRAGNTNERIEFVLQKFGVEPPTFFSTVSPKVEDIMLRDIVTAHASAAVYQAINHISEQNLRELPVTDHNNHCIGLLSALRVCRYLFPPRNALQDTRRVTASLSEIAAAFDGKILSGAASQNPADYILIVGAMGADTFSRRLAGQDIKNVVLLVGDRPDIQLQAIEQGVAALVITGELPVEDDIQKAAAKAKIPLIISPHDTATTVLLARGAVQARHMLEPEFKSFAPDFPLRVARAEVASLSDHIFPVLGADKTLLGVFSKSDLIKPVPRQLILVDHNELSQAVDGASEIPIAEVVDHHRLGSISTDTPILFMNVPVGSTCTIVATNFFQHGFELSPSIAGILMAGLISDTLNLTSPTTTNTDVEIMKKLSAAAGIEPTRLAEQIFSVGSPLLTMTSDKAIQADCKEYEECGIRFSLAQIEELTFSHYPEKKEALLASLEEYRKNRGLSFSAMLVTDITTHDSVLLVRGDATLEQLIDYPARDTHEWFLTGVVSRKKQLLPYMVTLLEKLK